MLSSAVAIISPTPLGGGQYQFQLHFEDSSKAKHLRVGDYIKSGVNEDKYEIDTWNGYPSDFSSGSIVTTTYVDNDVIPIVDSGYNSEAYTPNQIDLRPLLQTPGQIGNISAYSGQNYEYELQASWDDLVQADLAQVGDSIVDSDGKEFIITHLETNKFSSAFRMQEAEKVGIGPIAGVATLYRSTSKHNLYQGSAMSDPARTNIFNRDKKLLDKKIGVNGDWVTTKHTITAGEASAKEFTLSYTPHTPSEVIVFPYGGTLVEYGTDYTISGDTFSWSGLGLDGILAENDEIQFMYFTPV